MIKRRLCKAWQICSAAICYSLFGLGAMIIGLVFRLVDVSPFISAYRKQIWIRWCIHVGCLAFINTMKLTGLIRYTFDLTSMHQTKPGHLVIANHPTLIDVVLLFAAQKNLNCIVKGALWDNFFMGSVVRLAGFVRNDSMDTLAMAKEKLNAGENLLIFPEGTRKDNSENIRFKRGVSNLAIAANANILPVLIKCYPSALRKGDKWYKIPDGGPTFTLSSGTLLKLDECVDTTKPRTLQYRELTSFLENYYQDWMNGCHPAYQWYSKDPQSKTQ